MLEIMLDIAAVIILTGSGLNAQFIKESLPGYRIVDCTLENASIARWQPGRPLYDNCMARVETIGLPVAAVFHFHGETETIEQARAEAFEAQTLSFFEAIRADVGNVPIVFGKLGDAPNDIPRPYWQDVREAQQRISENYSANMVQTDGFSYCEGTTFCEAGQKLTAMFFADTFVDASHPPVVIACYYIRIPITGTFCAYQYE